MAARSSLTWAAPHGRRETGLAFAVGIMGTGLALLGALDSCDTAGQLPPG